MAVTMAKLSSSRPPLQGMMLLALLLLASIQAVQVMGSLEGIVVDAGKEIEEHVPGKLVAEFRDGMVSKAPNTAVQAVLNSEDCKKPALKDLCDGARWGFKTHKYMCRAQGWVKKLNPSASPYFLVSLYNYQLTVMYQGRECTKLSDEPQVPAVAVGSTGATTTPFPSSSYSYPRYP